MLRIKRTLTEIGGGFLLSDIFFRKFDFPQNQGYELSIGCFNKHCFTDLMC